MTITYTFQYRFFPKKWAAPSPPPISDNEHEDLIKTLEYRRIIAPFLKDWLSVIHTWQVVIKYSVLPFLLLFLIMGGSWSTFFILLLVVSLLSLFIWVKQRNYQRTVAMIEIVIDVVLNAEFGIKLPKILENE